MTERYTAAAIQFEPLLGAKEQNVARLLALVEEAAGAGARVIVMPEMAVTGYCFRDRAEAAPLVEPIAGPTTEAFAAVARRHGCYVAVGLAEVDPATNLYYNTAALVGPDGVLAAYRKSHAFISEPLWAAESVAPPPVVATPYGRLGLLICADADYVEPARLLGVAGCEVALFPTCWLDEKAPSAVWMTRAYENGMYLVAADRFGLEREVQFSGGSCVLDPAGRVVAMRDVGDGIVYGEIDLARTRTRPFAPEAPDDKLEDRRPGAYAALALHSYLWNPLQAHRLYGERGFSEGGRLRVAVVQSPAAPDTRVRGEATSLTAVESLLSQGERFAGGVPTGSVGWKPAPGLTQGRLEAGAPSGMPHTNPAESTSRQLELQEMAQQAVADGAGLVVLPALPLLVRPPESAAEAAAAAEGMDGATVQWLLALARDLDASIAGSLVERDGELLYLTALLAGPSGVVGRYRALHPSRAERAWATPGNLGLPVFDLPAARIGLLFGRDALFPEPARILALAGADVICAPAALRGPIPRGLAATAVPFDDARLRAASAHHFHLWRQRAAENNTYVAFANRAAPIGMGASGIFGPEPNGAEALVAGAGSGIAALDVDTSSLSPRFPTAAVRAKEMLHRRVPAMYAPLVSERR